MGTNSELYGDDITSFPLMYRGIVEDVNDTCQAGRIKIRVFGVHSDNKNYIKTEHLPWAIAATDLAGNGGGARNIGSFEVPAVGSHVWVFFEGGDHNFPVYFAGAPAIEDVNDYQEREGAYKEEKDGDGNPTGSMNYVYDKQFQYDDDLNDNSLEREKQEKFETKDKKGEPYLVQDWSVSARQNIHRDHINRRFSEPEKRIPNKEFQIDSIVSEDVSVFPDSSNTDPYENFYKTGIRIAFDGRSNHDALNYNGIYDNHPSAELDDTFIAAELDVWNERKWGWNDEEDPTNTKIDSKYEGGAQWKPTYPMVSCQRNMQGEITEFDVLRERKTYIHPSKYYHELVQLDAQREKEDFENELSIKRVYERQAGIGNSPDDPSFPKGVDFAGSSNESDPVESTTSGFGGRKNNEIIYENVELEQRNATLRRFEERKHNPGREKTVVEDFVYRFYMNKVNETFNVDRNTRIYRGNDNLEVERGDQNVRLHTGSYNRHMDVGNKNTIINSGWEHMHIDNGHQFLEIGGGDPDLIDKNGFTTSPNIIQHEEFAQVNVSAEDEGKMLVGEEYKLAQHTNTGRADKQGCDAKFADWEEAGHFDSETAEWNQFIRLVKGSQVVRIEGSDDRLGSQHFQINRGHQKFWIKEGHQTFNINKGWQRWQLDDGNMERYANGYRNSFYTGQVHEQSETEIVLEAPKIHLVGEVFVHSLLNVKTKTTCPSFVGHAESAESASEAPLGSFTKSTPSVTEKVPDKPVFVPAISASKCEDTE